MAHLAGDSRVPAARSGTDASSGEIKATMASAQKTARPSIHSNTAGVSAAAASGASELAGRKKLALRATPNPQPASGYADKADDGRDSLLSDHALDHVMQGKTAQSGRKTEADPLAHLLASRSAGQGFAAESLPAAKPLTQAEAAQALSAREPFEQLLKKDKAILAAIDNRPALNPQGIISTPAVPVDGMRIDSTVGSSTWNTALGQQVLTMVADGTQHAEIHLNPEDMGPIRITLSIDNSQADVSFMVREGATRDAIQSALPRLGAMMAEAGISLGQANVQADSSGGFTQPGQTRNPPHQASAASAKEAHAEAPAAAPGRQIATRIGLIDRFV
jgi:flagellar hook-length control protein FliK